MIDHKNSLKSKVYVIRQILLTALSEEGEGPECFLVRLQCVKAGKQRRAYR